MKNNATFSVVLPNNVYSSITSGKTNYCTHIYMYHSALTVFRSPKGIVAVCPVQPKKQAIIFLEVLLAETTSVGFGSSWNTHSYSKLLSAFWLIRIYPFFIICDDVVYGFCGSYVEFLQTNDLLLSYFSTRSWPKRYNAFLCIYIFLITVKNSPKKPSRIISIILDRNCHCQQSTDSISKLSWISCS